MRAQIHCGMSYGSPRFAAMTPRTRYVSIVTQIPKASDSAMTRAAVMLSSASRPPRMAQHTAYSRQLRDRLTAAAA